MPGGRDIKGNVQASDSNKHGQEYCCHGDNLFLIFYEIKESTSKSWSYVKLCYLSLTIEAIIPVVKKCILYVFQ